MSDDGFIAKKMAEGAATFRLFGLGPSGAGRTTLDKWSISIGLPTITDEIESKAKIYANTIGGNIAFQLAAYDDNDREMACEVFRLQAESAVGPLGLMTEPANEGGMGQQAMRHAEAFARQMLQQQAQTDRFQTRIMERILQRNEDMEARLVGGIELMGKLARDENAQAIELYKAKVGAETKHAITKKLMDVIPIGMDAMAAKYGGQTLSDATLTQATKAIFDGLNQTQIQTILGTLDETQRLQVMHVMKRLAAAEEANKPKTDATTTEPGEGMH